MPGFDRQGPQGAGPRTGLGRGRCGDGSGLASGAGYYGQGAGYGRGAGFGRGAGMGRAGRGGGRGRGQGLAWRSPWVAEPEPGLGQEPDQAAAGLDKNLETSLTNKLEELEKEMKSIKDGLAKMAADEKK